jgi:hypothetical protein
VTGMTGRCSEEVAERFHVVCAVTEKSLNWKVAGLFAVDTSSRPQSIWSTTDVDWIQPLEIM